MDARYILPLGETEGKRERNQPLFPFLPTYLWFSVIVSSRSSLYEKKKKKEGENGPSSTLCDIVLQHGQSLYPDSSVRSHRVSVWEALLGIQPSAADERLLSLLSYDPPQDDDGDDDDDYN